MQGSILVVAHSAEHVVTWSSGDSFVDGSSIEEKGEGKVESDIDNWSRSRSDCLAHLICHMVCCATC